MAGVCLAGFVLGLVILLYPSPTAALTAALVGIYLILLGADSLLLGFGPLGENNKKTM